jgi:cytidylate kinase
MYRIITIGREFGSGGREIGKRLASELGFAYYDKEIISAIAERSQLAEDYVNQVVENKIHTYYPITIGVSMATAPEDGMYAINRSIYAAQTEILEELAQKSDCVIVGRCADHILAEYKPFRIYVYADMAYKLARCHERGEDGEGLSDKELEKRIRAVDKARAQYYRFYTGESHDDRLTYDLGINTSTVAIRDAVTAIAALVRAKD